MPPLDTPSVLDLVSVVTHHAGPQDITPGDRLWLDPCAYSGVQCYATPRGFIAAFSPPADATEALGRVVSREWTLQP